MLLFVTVLSISFAGERYDDVGSRTRAAPAIVTAPRPALAGPHTLFVNFDGVTLEGDAWTDDATADRTVFPDLAGEWPPFGDMPGSAKREA
ncbi:MAG TPA: hypothetical protein VFG69_07750, partial [Nannocystaceae bacterium]|nr:hypothetical protein [Nannocystaceae bacterium]